MNSLLTIAEVAAKETSKSNPLLQFLPFIIIIGAMFFLTIRSQKKQAARRNEMLSKLVKGTDVLLANGIYGTIVEVSEKSYLVEIADDTVVKVIASGIADVIVAEDTEAVKK